MTNTLAMAAKGVSIQASPACVVLPYNVKDELYNPLWLCAFY